MTTSHSNSLVQNLHWTSGDGRGKVSHYSRSLLQVTTKKVWAACKRELCLRAGNSKWIDKGAQSFEEDCYGVSFQGFVSLWSSSFHPRVALHCAADAGSKTLKKNTLSWIENCEKRPVWFRERGLSLSLFSLLTFFLRIVKQ